MTTATLTNKNALNANSSTDADASLGRIVKAIREEVSMSVADLSFATGIGSRRLVAIEAGLSTSEEEHHLLAQAIARLLSH